MRSDQWLATAHMFAELNSNALRDHWECSCVRKCPWQQAYVKRIPITMTTRCMSACACTASRSRDHRTALSNEKYPPKTSYTYDILPQIKSFTLNRWFNKRKQRARAHTHTHMTPHWLHSINIPYKMNNHISKANIDHLFEKSWRTKPIKVQLNRLKFVESK